MIWYWIWYFCVEEYACYLCSYFLAQCAHEELLAAATFLEALRESLLS